MTKRRGRKRKAGPREDSGRPQRNTHAEKMAMMSVAVEARSRVYNLDLKDAKTIMAGCALGRAILNNPTNPNQDSRWWQAGLDYEQSFRDWVLATQNKPFGPKANSFVPVSPGHDNEDGTEPGYKDWYEQCCSKFTALKQAVEPTELIVLHRTVVDDMDIRPHLLGELRSALNTVARLTGGGN